MYFEGRITVDPDQLTKIEKVKPTKAFKKMLFYMTLGGVNEKQERETFTAVSILQQLNQALNQKEVSNIIRLSHDGIDFYLDKEGKTDDLKEAFDLYELKVGQEMSTYFEKITMVLEHEDDVFKYLLEIDICRNHTVGEYPIKISVSGLLKEFSAQQEDLNNKITQVFSSQEKYDEFKRSKLHHFTDYVDDLGFCVKRCISTDDIKKEIKTKIVFPKKKVKDKTQMQKNQTAGYGGVHYGYYGFDDFLFYNLLWTDLANGSEVSHNETHYETDTGDELGYLSEADSTDLFMDDSTDFEASTSIFEQSSTASSESSSGGWFDFGGFDSDGDGSSSCSSCSSCGSCGCGA